MLINPYTLNWIKDFNDIKHKLENSLFGFDCTIEHVGSTSVPNLDSKPIIDIDVIYYNLSDFEKIKSGLSEIGYYHNGNQGIEDRDVFKRDGKLIDEILDKINHHLYVCPVQSKALKRHILSRNFLRKNDWARLKYQQMKYEMAIEANQDKKMYAALKELNMNEFIDSIVEKEKQICNIDCQLPLAHSPQIK